MVLFFQPFIIGHIVCNNLFTAGVISLIMMGTSFILYFIFNIKGICSNVKLMSVLFIIPALASFIPVFLFDHDMAT